jgi:murein DD-endopeptidase MepM/ murein hydrolase activator NlpD
VALSGDTGFADRPELHFELRKGRTPVDPTSQLPRT